MVNHEGARLQVCAHPCLSESNVVFFSFFFFFYLSQAASLLEKTERATEREREECVCSGALSLKGLSRCKSFAFLHTSFCLTAVAMLLKNLSPVLLGISIFRKQEGTVLGL